MNGTRIASAVAVIGFKLSLIGSAGATPPAKSENELPPIGHTMFCASYPKDCAKQEPSALFQLMTERALYDNLAIVNKWINSAIVPDAGTAAEDVDTKWTILPSSGRCYDFAVSKRHQLLKMGWPSSALLLAEVALETGEHHLVLVATIKGKRFILDNLSVEPIPMNEAKNYSWIRVQSYRDLNYWVRPNLM